MLSHDDALFKQLVSMRLDFLERVSFVAIVVAIVSFGISVYCFTRCGA